MSTDLEVSGTSAITAVDAKMVFHPGITVEALNIGSYFDEL